MFMSVCALGNVQKITEHQYLTVKQISFSTLSLNVRGLRDKFKLDWGGENIIFPMDQTIQKDVSY